MLRVNLVVAIVIAAGLAAEVSAREWKDAAGNVVADAELVLVRNGKVILEKADGEIITIALDKLSAADKDFLKAPAPPAGTPAPAPANTAAAPVSVEQAALAEKAQAVLRANCYRCHGDEGSSEGGFNFALNLEKLARTLVKPRNLTGSLLFERLTATDESRMPPEGERSRPSADEIAAVKAWIEAGAPALPSEKPRVFITNDEVARHVLADIRQAAPRSQRFLRYFTLTHLHNAGVSEDELQTYRNALAKLLNSLSWNTRLVVPQAVDPARTVLRVDLRELHWTSAIWEEIEAANPYFLAQTSPDALSCYELAQCRMPFVRVDWFVFAASKPPLYHTVLGLPTTDRGLEEQLKVNVQANIDQEQAIRAAFNRSGVSQNNRLIEWHRSPYGSYWKSYDFGGNTDRQNLFERPLGPGAGRDEFQHDGGEIIFTLPNGLQAYLLVDAAGKRIDQGPTSIVSDPKRPDKTVTNGVSCMSCHYTGVIAKADEVGGAVRANPKAFQNSADILALYREPKQLAAVFQQDAKRFTAALSELGITSQSRGGEPVSAMALRFEQELDLPMTACEFGLTPQEFQERLAQAETVNRTFAPLAIPGGTIKRDVLATAFGRAAVELRLVVEGSLGGRLAASAAPLVRLPVGDGKPGEVRRFKDLTWGVHSLAFSASGGFLAAGKPDGQIHVFDVLQDSRADVLEKLEMLQSIQRCQYTPDGTRLLAAGSTGHISIYAVAKDGRLKDAGQFAGHSKGINCLAVSADGRFALSGGREEKVRYWEIDAGRELAVFTGFEGTVKACHIDPRGRTALATDGQTLLEIDLTKREVTGRRKLTNSTAAGQAAAFSQDGRLVAAGDTYAIRLFDVGAGKELPVLQDSEIQWSMTFTPDSTRLLSGGNGKVNVWDVAAGRKVYSHPLGEIGYVQCLAASPDNKHAAAIASRDVQVFRLPEAEK